MDPGFCSALRAPQPRNDDKSFTLSPESRVPSPESRVPSPESRLLLEIEERAKLFAARRMPQLAQRLGLDLADALAGDVELLANFFQGVVGVHVDAEAHAQHLGFARGQARQHVAHGFGEA